MLEAGFWGFVSAAALIIGAVIALTLRPPRRFVGLVMAFGAGALISAVAYELIEEATITGGQYDIAFAMLIGAVMFVGGDALIERSGGHDLEGKSFGEERGPAIVLGTVLDGLPESFVLGLSLVGEGGTSVAFIAAVFLSNLPEALGATASLSRSGWSAGRILTMWTGLAVVSGIAAALGYGYFHEHSSLTGLRVQAFAAGAILAMLADTMIPESFAEGGRFTGIVLVLGFILAVALSNA